MDQAKILETICDLFLMSKLLWKDLCDIIKGDIEKGQYEKVAKLFIYRIILEMNTESIYDRIRKEEIESCIFILISIDKKGFKDPFIIEEYTSLMIRFFKYLLEYKLNLRTNKEKWNL